MIEVDIVKQSMNLILFFFDIFLKTPFIIIIMIGDAINQVNTAKSFSSDNVGKINASKVKNPAIRKKEKIEKPYRLPLRFI